MTTHWHHPKNALYTHVSRFSLETLNLFTKQEKQQLRVETLVLSLPAFTRFDQSDGRILPASVRTGPASSTGFHRNRRLSLYLSPAQQTHIRTYKLH